MKNAGFGLIGNCLLCFLVIAVQAVRPTPAFSQGLIVILKPDMTIGVDDGDENLMFGSISRIDLDGKGNIYVLDYKNRKIGVFGPDGKHVRSISVPAGQGPREATNIGGIAVGPSGMLFINAMRKVIVYGSDGGFIRSFLVDFGISSIGCPGTEDMVAIGPHNGNILHVFDQNGKLLNFFGDPFPVPKEFEAMKDMPMFVAPLIFNCGKDGRIFVLNPHKYEISIFKDRKLESVLRGKNDLFKPIQKMGRAFISTAVHIVQSGEFVFVVFQNADPKAQKKMDVFRGGRQIGTMDVSGTPFVADPQGRLYFGEDEGFPKIRRYTVIGK